MEHGGMDLGKRESQIAIINRGWGASREAAADGRGEETAFLCGSSARGAGSLASTGPR
jgi:hypothetical protein